MSTTEHSLFVTPSPERTSHLATAAPGNVYGGKGNVKGARSVSSADNVPSKRARFSISSSSSGDELLLQQPRDTKRQMVSKGHQDGQSHEGTGRSAGRWDEDDKALSSGDKNND